MQAAELARAMRNLPEEVKKYKTIAAFEQQAMEFLDAAAAGVPAQKGSCSRVCMRACMRACCVRACGYVWAPAD